MHPVTRVTLALVGLLRDLTEAVGLAALALPVVCLGLGLQPPYGLKVAFTVGLASALIWLILTLIQGDLLQEE